MRSASLPEWPGRWAGSLPAAAIAVSEGAWVAVLYGALRIAAGHDDAPVGLWGFAGAAGLGILVTRRVATHRRMRVLVVLVPAMAVAGWMLDPVARAMAMAGSFDAALAVHGVGMLLGSALWRGSRYGGMEHDDLIVAGTLRLVLPALALPWLVAGGTGPGSVLASHLVPGTVLFVAGGLLAIGLLRLDALGRAAGATGERDRAWAWLVLAVVAIGVMAMASAAGVTHASSSLLAQHVLGPIGALLSLVTAAVGDAGAAVAALLARAGPGSPDGPGVTPVTVALPDVPASAMGWLWLLTTAALVTAALLVTRALRGGPPGRPKAPPPAHGREGRRLRIPLPPSPRPTVRLPRRGGRRWASPTTASDAYLSFLDRVTSDPRRARRASESPTAHARRLRQAGDGSLTIDLLAADYVLEHDGGVRLSPSEVDRAFARLAALVPRRPRWRPSLHLTSVRRIDQTPGA